MLMVKVVSPSQVMVASQWRTFGESFQVSQRHYEIAMRDYPHSLQILSPVREVVGAEPLPEEVVPPAITTTSKKKVASSEPKNS